MKLGSLFDGIGGALLCAKRCGIEPVWASEIEPFPIKVTEHHFPKVKHLGDITQINGAEIEPVDIIIGGSPCQDLSVAGKRVGLAGERSGLFMDQIRIVKEMRNATSRQTGNGSDQLSQPRYMVWENVPGAFSSNKGEDFRAVLEEICWVCDPEISIPEPAKKKWLSSGTILGDGYSVAWRTVDAQYWGVPQRRRRIYLVTDFGGQSAPEILFESESVPWNFTESRSEGKGTAGDAEGSFDSAICYGIDQQGGKGGANYTENVSPTILSESHGTPHAVCYSLQGNMIDTAQGGQRQPCIATYSFQRSDELKESEVASTQLARQYKDATDLVVASIDCRNFNETPKHGTLQAKENGGQSLNYSGAVRVNKQVRRLTPKECERLQGYPDGYTNIPGASDSARYKALGNSFAIPNAYFVISNISNYKVIGNIYDKEGLSNGY